MGAILPNAAMVQTVDYLDIAKRLLESAETGVSDGALQRAERDIAEAHVWATMAVATSNLYLAGSNGKS